MLASPVWLSVSLNNLLSQYIQGHYWAPVWAPGHWDSLILPPFLALHFHVASQAETIATVSHIHRAGHGALYEKYAESMRLRCLHGSRSFHLYHESIWPVALRLPMYKVVLGPSLVICLQTSPFQSLSKIIQNMQRADLCDISL